MSGAIQSIPKRTLASHYLTKTNNKGLGGKSVIPFFSFSDTTKKGDFEWTGDSLCRAETPPRRWEMASPNNTEPYNGSDRRAIKQSGSWAFQISFAAHPSNSLGDGRLTCELSIMGVGSGEIPAGGWSGRAEGTSTSDLFSHSRH